MNRCHVLPEYLLPPRHRPQRRWPDATTGRYRCVKCRFEFTDVANWRTGAPPSPAPLPCRSATPAEGQASWAA